MAHTAESLLKSAYEIARDERVQVGDFAARTQISFMYFSFEAAYGKLGQRNGTKPPGRLVGDP